MKEGPRDYRRHRATADALLQDTAQFWLNLQAKFGLEIAEDEELDKIERDVRPIEVDAR